MKTTIRYVLLWGPLALSAKNWIIDIKQLDSSSFPHHHHHPNTATFSSPNTKLSKSLQKSNLNSNNNISTTTTLILIQKYKIKIFREFNRGDIIYLKSPEDPGDFWVRRLVGIEDDTVYYSKILKIVPQGHCWVERLEEASGCAVPLALVEGRISHILWPPSKVGNVQSCLPFGKILQEQEFSSKNSKNHTD